MPDRRTYRKVDGQTDGQAVPGARPHAIVLSYHFPPSAAVGAQRPARLVDALLVAGFDVDVVCAGSGPGQAQGPSKRPSERASDDALRARLRVHVIPMRPGAREWVRDHVRRLRRWRHGVTAWTGRCTRDAFRVEDLEPGHGVGAVLTADARVGVGSPTHGPPRGTTWRRWTLSLLRIPDDQHGFILPAIRRTLPLVRPGRSVLYCTAPPVSTLVAGTLASWWRRLPCIVELRDPWVGNPGKGAHTRSRLSDVLDTWLERLCVGRARFCVTVTEAVAVALRTRHSERPSGGVIVVPTGIPRDAVPAIAGLRRAPGDVLRLVYAGNLYLERDPRPVLEAMAHYRRAAGGRRIHLDFVGECETFRGQSVVGLARTLGIEADVVVRPPEPRAAALARLKAADVLLLLARGQPMQVPQKLYDYLGIGRPILALVDECGETAQLLERVGGHQIVTTDDPVVIARALVALRSQAERGSPEHILCSPASRRALEELRAERQMLRLVHLVRRAGSRPTLRTRHRVSIDDRTP